MHRVLPCLLLTFAIAISVGRAGEVTPAKAADLIGDKIQLLDVRTEQEWNEGHIKGAMRIGIAGDDFEARVAKELNRSKPVLVYCRSGNRSRQAVGKLEKLGFKTVHDLKGGIKAWVADGRPVTK